MNIPQKDSSLDNSISKSEFQSIDFPSILREKNLMPNSSTVENIIGNWELQPMIANESGLGNSGTIELEENSNSLFGQMILNTGIIPSGNIVATVTMSNEFPPPTSFSPPTSFMVCITGVSSNNKFYGQGIDNNKWVLYSINPLPALTSYIKLNYLIISK